VNSTASTHDRRAAIDGNSDTDSSTSNAPDPEAARREPRTNMGQRWRRSQAPRFWMRLVTAILVAVLLAGAAWTAKDVVDQRSDERLNASALAAGRDAAVAFTSYDYRHINQDLDRVTSESTGTFRQQFSKALGALTAAIKQAHGVSRGTVTQAGLVRSSAAAAVVIASVDAQITNSATRGVTLRRYRLQITLNRVAATWLIADIQPVA
jgi:Mce-associated membrane protein